MAYITDGGLEYKVIDASWVEGSFDGYWWQAKLSSQEEAEQAIEGRRVLKLALTDDPENWNPAVLLANYEMGWDVEPDDDIAEEIAWLIGELEKIYL